MRPKSILGSLTSTLAILLLASAAHARPQLTDYMACYVSAQENMVQLMVIPQAYSGGNMGKAEPIVSRSCESKLVPASGPIYTTRGLPVDPGSTYKFDCKAQIAEMREILAQMQWSTACPPSKEAQRAAQSEEQALKRQSLEATLEK